MMEKMPVACPSPCTSLKTLGCDSSHLPLEALPGRLLHRLTWHTDGVVMASGLTYLSQWFLEFTHCCPLAPPGAVSLAGVCRVNWPLVRHSVLRVPGAQVCGQIDQVLTKWTRWALLSLGSHLEAEGLPQVSLLAASTLQAVSRISVVSPTACPRRSHLTSPSPG